jgi:hypothetical protein
MPTREILSVVKSISSARLIVKPRALQMAAASMPIAGLPDAGDHINVSKGWEALQQSPDFEKPNRQAISIA